MMKSEKQSQHKLRLAVASIAGLILALTAQSSTYAQPANEVFNAVPQNSSATSFPRAFTPAPLNTVAAPGAMDQAGAGKTPETRWFEKMDSIIFSGYPTPGEKSILSRPFNQEAERVQQWTMTAQVVAQRYRGAAKALRNDPTPSNWTELAQYKDARADWFDDAASVYEDLFRPRKPATTIEELESQLNEVKNRADQLAEVKKTNREWDRKLRVHYRVHAPKETDALSIYVGGSPK